MAWPTGQDYNEAIQSPQSVFADADLKGGRAETNQHGFPRPRAGAFATVYRIESGSRAWAVRCFNRDTNDLQERYLAISAFLERETLPYFVNFEYLPQGIRVKGLWYPVLKMEWLHGEPLNVYIERNLRDSASLFKLASDWLQMATSLAKAGIAHGDLQHGNVLLVGANLKLIDYDGMYVPALSGKLSRETGQPNYQLPARTAYDYGPQLDHFSEWVVLVSVLALCSDPALWKTFRGGDECLLFRKSDFEDPASSQLFRTLERSTDQQVAALVSVFRSYLGLSPSAVPSVDGSFLRPSSQAPSSSQLGQPDWLKDHLEATNAPLRDAVDVIQHLPEQSFSADWLLDFTAQPGESMHFAGSFFRARMALLFAFSTTLILWRFHLSLVTTGIDFLVWLFTFIGLRQGYSARPETAQFTELQSRIATAKAELSNARDGRDGVIRERDDFRKSIAGKRAQSDRERERIQAEEKSRSVIAELKHQATARSLTGRLNAFAAQETADLASIQKNLGPTLAQRKADLTALDQSETNEKAALLKQKCDLHMWSALSSASLTDASIPGIGLSLKKELWRGGIRSARDVSRYGVSGVKGIGTAKSNALVGWKMIIENQALTTMPRLTSQEQLAINQKYKDQRARLRDEISSREKVIDSEQRSVRAKYASSKDSIAVQIRDATGASAVELRSIITEFAARYAKFDVDARSVSGQELLELSAFDARITDATRILTSVQWHMGKLDRERKTFSNITFKAFLSRTFIWR